MARSPRYDDARYGVVTRVYLTGKTAKFDVATVGTVADYSVSFPRKSRIIGFGIQAVATDVVFATSDTIELRTANGTKLATLVGDGDTTLGSFMATMAAPETATSVARNMGLIVCVGTNAMVSGSAVAFVDVAEDLDDTHEP